jgi:general secretion pathway protein G
MKLSIDGNKTMGRPVSAARRLRKGFTLIELMVVILILAILAALIVPRIVGRAQDAKIAAAKSDEATLAAALHQFHLDCDRYPTTEEGLNALQNAPSGLEQKWKGPYLTKDVGNDPWTSPYQYQSPGSNGSQDSFTITSYGSTMQPGGSDQIVDTE